MNTGTQIIVERIRNGNRSARTRISKKHFADLFEDLSTYGADRLLDAIGEELAPSTRKGSPGREKGDFEQLVDSVKVRTTMNTRDILDRMYAELKGDLGNSMPSKTTVRSMPKFLAHFGPQLGEAKLCQVLRKIVKRDFPAH